MKYSIEVMVHVWVFSFIASITLIFFFLTKFRVMYCIQQNSISIWVHLSAFDVMRNHSIFAPYTSMWCLIFDINYCVDHVHMNLFFLNISIWRSWSTTHFNQLYNLETTSGSLTTANWGIVKWYNFNWVSYLKSLISNNVQNIHVCYFETS